MKKRILLNNKVVSLLLFMGIISITLTPKSSYACFCECDYSSECGIISWCDWTNCLKPSGRVAYGICKIFGIFSVADQPQRAQALDLWLQAYEVAGASGGGSPDPTLVAQARSIPISQDQHDAVRLVAIFAQAAYLGFPTTTATGLFSFPNWPGSETCDATGSANDNGAVGSLGDINLGVASLIRQAMVGELQNPDQGIFDNTMSQIPVQFTGYQTGGACEFPHPPSHGHTFPFADGFDCLNEEVRAALSSLMFTGTVPTLSQRGLIIFTLLLLTFGTVFIYRRQTA